MLNEDKPFSTRILGLEKTDNYIRYDLLQLLALFFHKSLLMRYGLWDHEGPLDETSPAKENCMDKETQRGEKEETAGQDSKEDVCQSGVESKDADESNRTERQGPTPVQSEKAIQDMYRPAHCFFNNILHAEYRAVTDVYALMFLTDVVDFIIIVFGFWAFGKHSAAADIASSLSDDQVPEAFLVMLLIQFSTMIIDRALYLRKTVLGKLIFQVRLQCVSVTERMFNQNFVAQLWYLFKCIYFGLSAYQIRCGYPTRILGNFLTKGYNHLNLFLFQGFRLVPFLVELRAVMDWVWTDTTLSLSNWMCVEDIYANIFIIKCSRETEKKYPQPKGQKKKKIVKYGMGGLIIFFLICIIWFPLLFISLVRSVVGVVNHPIDVTVTVKLGGYEVAMQFITFYSHEDIVTARIEGSSGSVWRISPPSRQEVIKELLGSPVDLTLRLAWNFQRDLGKGGTVEHTFDKHSINLEPGNPVRADLASLLVGNRTEPVIMGLYVSVVLVIGKFVRGFFSEISHSIMFEELPCVDRILKLCTDIFLVRETGELELEEELYSKLIFLYRSPETMIKWTRDMQIRRPRRN
ncbi:hypothetical protein CRUP_000540 [Coryphaenoides rupestris]|nr:hypothetical protein CRUP_000540 [Coryphaenoides rupestris]